MDRYIELVAEAMSVELAEPITYVHGSEAGEPFCEQEGVLGCAFDDSVYSVVAPQEHELVHGVRGLAGFSQLFFEEGTAELYGDDAILALRVPANGELLEGIEEASGEDGLPSRWYPRAGHFVAHLQERYGSSVGEAILRETDPYTSAGRAIEVIEGVTGMPFAEVRMSYESEPDCDQAHYRYPLYACEDPAALRARCNGSTAMSIHETIACDDASTLGPRDGEIWKYIAFEVPADGEYSVFSYSSDGSAGSTLSINECSMRCDAIRIEKPVGIEIPLLPTFLRAGRYEARITRPAEAPGSVEVRVSGEDCG